MVDNTNPSPSAIHSLPPKPASLMQQDGKPGIKPVPLKTPAKGAPSKKAAVKFSSLPFWSGILFSMAWIVGVVAVLVSSGEAHAFAGVPLAEWAIGITAVCAPIGLIWMVSAYMQRAVDIHAVVDPLRRQLTLITGESGLAEQRVRRFNQAIREQLELLRETKNINHDDLMAIMDNVREHKAELDQFERNSLTQVKDIQNIIRHSLQHIEQVMDDKFTMLRILDGKMSETGAGVAHQANNLREQLGTILMELESNSNLISVSLDRAKHDSKKLSEMSQVQQTSLLSAADTASATMGELSGRIDLNIARFLERASSAREEAERLAGALDIQTRAIDELSTTLPTRVGEAEAVLRGVADRLYASEQMAREQAVTLSDSLSAQTDSLQKVLGRFGVHVAEADGTLQQRQSGLDSLVEKIRSSVSDLAERLEGTMTDWSSRADNSLSRFRAVNETAREGAEQIASSMGETTKKYEEACAHLEAASSAENTRIAAMTSQISEQIRQFESLRDSSKQTGADVQADASMSMQNLQGVLDRLLAAKDATQVVGEALTDKLKNAVNENESLIVRLNEAAQMSVRALGTAAESLRSQEGAVVEKTRTSESAISEIMAQMASQAVMAEDKMRAQSQKLASLLEETENRLGATETRLDDFASQAVQPVRKAMAEIEQHTMDGLSSLGHYSDNMHGQLGSLQQFNAQVTAMGTTVAQHTASALDTIEQLNQRFVSLRSVQEETARATIDAFKQVADRARREVEGLGEKGSETARILDAVVAQILSQTESVTSEAQDSGAKLKAVMTALQEESVQTRVTFQKQSDDLRLELARAEQQFVSAGDQFKQRVDGAYQLVDKIADHYSEKAQKVAADFENKTALFDQATSKATGKVEELSVVLEKQVSSIDSGANKIEAQAAQIAQSAARATQQIGSLSEKISDVGESTEGVSQKAVANLEEVNSAFMRQYGTLNDTAQNAASIVQKATAGFAEQAGKLMDASQKTEQQIRGLGAATSTLAEQTTQIRASMEQQSQRLLASLTEAVAQMDVTSVKLQQSVATATLGADQAADRFGAMTASATKQIETSTSEISSMASATETTLSSLGEALAQQTVALGAASAQIAGQHKEVSAANEDQRIKLMSLFEKIGSAHAEASGQAEKTIAQLAESLQQITRQINVLGDQSKTSITNVRTATGGFADQAALLIQNAQAAEQQARTVLSVTSALQEQARDIRENLHQEGERTSDILSSLLGKISAGGSELRDLGTNAESSLTTLQAIVGKQTADLSSSMQQITERQRTMTAALDQQREVLNGLLCRLTLAQDEVASTAERGAARLADSAEQVSRQIESIDDRAKAALSSVRTISGGLSDETGSLQLQVQQAEQQLRSMLSVASGMQDQARQMREAVGEESTRVLSSLGGVTSKFEEATEKLKGSAADAVRNVDEAILQLGTIAQSGCAALQQQAGSLTETSESVETRLKAASDVLANTVKQIKVSSVAAEDKAMLLTQTAEKASAQIDSLRSSLSITDNDGRSLLSQVSERIDLVKAKLYDELQHIADVSDTSVRLIETASEKLMTQSDALRSNLSSSESALVAAADIVRAEGDQVPAVLDRSAQRMAVVTESFKEQSELANQMLKDQTKEIGDTLVHTADRFICASGAVRDSMLDEMKTLESVATTAEQTLRDFTKALSEQLIVMKDGAQLLSSEQGAMVSSANQALSQLASSTDRLNALHQESTKMANELVRAFSTVEQRGEIANKKLEDVSTSIASQIEQLAATSARAENQMLGASQNFRDQLEKVRSGIQGQIEDINRGLMQITAQLDRTSMTLRSATTGTISDIENIAGKFEKTGVDAAAHLSERTARMRTATEEAAGLLNGFGDQLDSLLNRMAVAGDGIKRHENDLQGQLHSALGQLGSIAERLEANRILAADVSDQTVSRLAEVADVVEKQMRNFSADTDSVSGIMRGVGDMYGEQAETLNRSVTDAQNQVLAMEQVVESLQQRADRMRVSLKIQGDELVHSLEQILRQLATAGDIMGDTLDDLDTRSQGGSQRVG